MNDEIKSDFSLDMLLSTMDDVKKSQPSLFRDNLLEKFKPYMNRKISIEEYRKLVRLCF